MCRYKPAWSEQSVFTAHAIRFNMKKLFVTIYFCVVFYSLVTAPDPIGPIRAFIQTNLVGLPVLHAQQTWDFDPDVALRRRRQFVELHGDKGDRLIERLGLGLDGYEEERLQKQRLRDEGHLGGLNYFLP